MTQDPLFNDTLCIWPNTVSLERAIAVVRDMRGCTRTVLLSPNFFLAHGPNGIRCFYELGIRDVILDVRLLGTPKETWQCVIEAAKQGVKAISIHALAGVDCMAVAIEAAKASLVTTLKVKRPAILVSTLPISLSDGDMVDQLKMRVRRKGHLEQATRHALAAGADGMIAEFEDIRPIRRISREIPLLVFTQKKAGNYAEVEPEETRDKPGIAEILRAKANHVIFDSTFVDRTDVEWASDLINKELAVCAA